MKRVVITILLFAFAVGAAWGQDGLQTRTSVEYAVHDGVSLVGDLYSPTIGGPHPAMVFIHGGGFTSGSGSVFLYRGGNLVRNGDAVVVSMKRHSYG